MRVQAEETATASQKAAPRRLPLLHIVLVVIGCLLFVVFGFRSERVTLKARDFKPVYGSARCLLAHCNPYDEGQTEQQFLTHGGLPGDPYSFQPFNANYPPSALFLALPAAALPYPQGLNLALGFGSLLFCIAALCILDLCAPYGSLVTVVMLAAFVANSTILIMLGQPAMITIATAVIASWALLRQRYPALAIAAFAISLAIKPHVAGLVFLYFFLMGGSYRKRSLQIAAASAVLIIVPMVWCWLTPASAHWVRDYKANLVGIALPGHASDPSLANRDSNGVVSLHAIAAVFNPNPKVYTREVYAFSAVLFGFWFYAVYRMRDSEAKHLLALASIACLSLMPIYHRHADTRMLLFTFPALALLLSWNRVLGIAGVIFTFIAMTLTSQTYERFMQRHFGAVTHIHGLTEVMLTHRCYATGVLVAGLFYLYCFVWAAGQEPRRPGEPLSL